MTLDGGRRPPSPTGTGRGEEMPRETTETEEAAICVTERFEFVAASPPCRCSLTVPPTLTLSPGDTSAAGLQRIDWALDAPNIRILVLELGANDGLRGLPVGEMKKNLAAIIERAQQKRIAVLLTGMEAPPNFGPEYVVSFRQAYRDLAKEYNVPLLPFLLDKVAGVPALNQADGIHPTVEGAAIVADNVWTMLKPMVDAAAR